MGYLVEPWWNSLQDLSHHRRFPERVPEDGELADDVGQPMREVVDRLAVAERERVEFS